MAFGRRREFGGSRNGRSDADCQSAIQQTASLRYRDAAHPPTSALASAASGVLRYRSPVEQATVTTFLDLIGIPDDTAKLRHFEAVTIDLREGRLAGVSDSAPTINGQRLSTVEEFINEHRALFDLANATTTERVG